MRVISLERKRWHSSKNATASNSLSANLQITIRKKCIKKKARERKRIMNFSLGISQMTVTESLKCWFILDCSGSHFLFLSLCHAKPWCYELKLFFLIFSFILIFGETFHSVIYSAAPCKMVLFICAGIYVFIFLNYYFLKEALGVDQKLNAVTQSLITHVVVTYFDLM